MSDKSNPAVDRKPAPEGKDSAAGNAAAMHSVKATELLGESRTLQIKHAGSDYTLRITRNDKLILTK